MIAFKHILCPVDLSKASERPLAYAAALARWYDAALTILHVVPTFDPITVQSSTIDGPIQTIYPVSREDVMRDLRNLADSAGAGLPDVNFSAEAGDPIRTIVDQAVAIPADLVVMGTHGRSGFERFVIGSVAERVLRKAPCPVLTVPPHVAEGPPDEVRFKHILCPVDFSPASLQAFGFAVDLARQADGRVTVLHTIEWLAEEEPREYAHFNVPEYRKHLLADADARLKALVAGESQTWAAIEEVVVLGRAHREILRAADTADLIVMGTQGRGGLGLSLFGSTTQQVVRAAACPVLTVRGAGPQAAPTPA